MPRAQLILSLIFVAAFAAACNRQQANETAETAGAAVDNALAEAERERTEAVNELEQRIATLERDWNEKEKQITDKTRTATAGLREETKEDVANVRAAIADLKTTTAANWWERHEQAMERTAADIEQDVRRLAPKFTPAQARAAASEGEAAFESRRDRVVAALRARVDAMETALKDVRADGPRETEVNDTRARVEKLKDDLDGLGRASADDWWDISSRRVREYIERVESSIRRLDDDKS